MKTGTERVKVGTVSVLAGYSSVKVGTERVLTGSDKVIVGFDSPQKALAVRQDAKAAIAVSAGDVLSDIKSSGLEQLARDLGQGGEKDARAAIETLRGLDIVKLANVTSFDSLDTIAGVVDQAINAAERLESYTQLRPSTRATSIATPTIARPAIGISANALAASAPTVASVLFAYTAGNPQAIRNENNLFALLT